MPLPPARACSLSFRSGVWTLRSGSPLAQGLLVLSINGQYFKAYVPFLVLSNLLAMTLFLTTYLIRIDIGLSFTLIWFGVIFLHALCLRAAKRLQVDRWLLFSAFLAEPHAVFAVTLAMH